ncbi:MAG TPA: carboxypeptidase-like regulatory domain-containing protein, partial [Flavobacterium sp.]|nr:carboxypeptidase-like regulatory domain-containing protein [Flavobacterium sp.]
MKHFFLLFFFFTLSLQAQFQVNGIIKDASTQKTLPFASIITNDGTNTISDVDGKFSISSINKITSITVTYIGYLKNTISTEN